MPLLVGYGEPAEGRTGVLSPALLPLTPPGRMVEALGLSTRVIDTGPDGEAEAVVFLHGVPGSADAWFDLIPQVGVFGRAVAFDLPGFGAAEAPPGWDYTTGGWSCFLAALLHELGIERAHLVMHDVGGVGLMWAAAHPSAFASAVLIDTGVMIDYRWHAVARLHRAPGVGRLATVLGGAALPITLRALERAPRRLEPEQIDDWRRAYDRRARRAMLHFYRSTAASGLESLASALRPLDRPALVLWGAHDPFAGVELAERQREAFPSAEVVVLPESGHYPHLDDPDGVAELVVPFLEELLLPEGLLPSGK